MSLDVCVGVIALIWLWVGWADGPLWVRNLEGKLVDIKHKDR